MQPIAGSANEPAVARVHALKAPRRSSLPAGSQMPSAAEQYLVSSYAALTARRARDPKRTDQGAASASLASITIGGSVDKLQAAHVEEPAPAHPSRRPHELNALDSKDDHDRPRNGTRNRRAAAFRLSASCAASLNANMARMPAGTTLQPTAWSTRHGCARRLRESDWQSRAHFLAAAAEAMRTS